MSTDPIHRFERLAEIARDEAPPVTEVTEAVMKRLERVRVARIDSIDRSRLWFAAITTGAAAVACLLLWPNGEVTLDTYALLWSPLGGALP